MNASNILSLIHHFVGSIGIFLIAYNQLGFFLGFYFAFTEISTPFLNLSWIFRTKKIMRIFQIIFFFCRILSSPFLLYYLHVNYDKIMSLSLLNRFMSFYGSYSLIALNIIWYVMISRHISHITSISD